MSESLGELLRRSADAVSEPHFDVAELVAGADRRQRHRRLAVAGAAAVVVGVVAVGSIAFRSDPSAEPDPAPSPPPSPPGSVAVDPAGKRPLVYAEGSTVHVGDQTFDAGGSVTFVDATDDGVVFMTGCSWPRPACTDDTDGEWFSDTLWFSDGSTTKAIGRAPTEHIGLFEVYTANPGSLVVWADATSRTKDWITRFVVYDTSRQEVVGRIPYTGIYNTVLHVDEGHVFFNPDSETPGCWVIDVQSCSDARLLRYDLASGKTRTISAAAFEAELRTEARQLLLAEARGDTGTAYTTGAMARFNQVGSRLEPVDSNGDPTAFMMTTGEHVALRLPAGYTAPGEEMPLVQWLDDHRVVLFPNEGGGDFPPRVGDFLECRLPDGRCRVVVSASPKPYLAPG
jgi:hypothetical protein